VDVTPPSLAAQAAGSMRTIPFWDLQAFPAASSTVDQNTGAITVSPGKAEGIYTSLPENPNDPWPENISTWNTIKLGGMRAPGIVYLTGGRGRRIDANRVPGASGYMPSFMGYDAGEFVITVKIWTAKQFAWLVEFLNLISPPPSAKIEARAVKADHPALALIQVYDVFVHKLGLAQIDDHGVLTLPIYTAEYLPPLFNQVGPIQPGYEKVTNPDGTYTVSAKTPPAPPSTTSIGP
jgi:hypothetical protein